MGKTLEITDKNFNDIISKNKTVLVDFWAEWCGPCRIIGPVIEELANEYEGKAIIGKLDVDSNQESSVKYEVRSIPTIITFKDGKIVDRQVGAVPKETLKNVEGMLNKGIDVVCAGLDQDSRGKPWETSSMLLGLSDKITKIYGFCNICGQEATKTYRKIDGGGRTHVGASDSYEPRCLKHWEPK